MQARHFATHDKTFLSGPSSSGKFIPTARAGHPNASGRSKTARAGAEVRTAGSSASIRAPVSPTGPPISLSATTLPTKKSNRPHEERVLRAPPSATVRRFHAPEDPERFRPVRMPFPEDRLRAAHRSDTVRRTDDPARLSPATAPARKKKPPTVQNRGERSDVPVIASADSPHFENPA